MDIDLLQMDFEYITTRVEGPGSDTAGFETVVEGCSCVGACTAEAGCSCLWAKEVLHP